MMEEGEREDSTRNLILSAIAEKENLTFLELCYVIYETKDKKTEAKKILAILEDDDLIRRMRQIEAITEENENKIYYYEQDEKSPTKLSYKPELEKSIRNIRNEQLRILARILKDINAEEEIEL